MRKSRLLFLFALVTLATGCASNNLLPAQKRSVHFEKTVKHLDLGGTVFVYADIAGDFEKLAEFVDGMAKQFAVLKKDEALSKINFKALIAKMGFNELQSVGMSSHRQGKLFHNKAFLLYQGPRKGFMKATGGSPHAFETPKWAPANVDLVFEKDFNGRVILKVVSSIMRDVMGDKAGKILKQLDKSIPGLKISPREVIEALDTRLIGVVRIDDSKIIRLPDSDFDFPFTEMLLAIDQFGFVFDDLVEKAAALPMLEVKKDDRFHTLSVVKQLPGDLNAYHPLLAKDMESGRVYLATTRAFLDEMNAGKNSLGKAKNFTQATQGLPCQGNSLVYTSDKFVGKLNVFLAGMLKHLPDAAASIDFFQSLLPEPGMATAQVIANLPDGIYMASNSCDSHKSTLLATIYSNPAMMGILAAVAIPAFIDYQKYKR
jgi:hypothetical protein